MIRVPQITLPNVDVGQFVDFYMSNLQRIFYAYSKKNLIKALNNINRSTLYTLRSKLGEYFLDICNIPEHFLSLKTRKSTSAVTCITTDIYTLTYVSLEKTFFEKLDSIFTSKIKPNALFTLISSNNNNLRMVNQAKKNSNTSNLTRRNSTSSQATETINFQQFITQLTTTIDSRFDTLTNKMEEIAKDNITTQQNVAKLQADVLNLTINKSLLENSNVNQTSTLNQMFTLSQRSTNNNNHPIRITKSSIMPTKSSIPHRRTIVSGYSGDEFKSAPPKAKKETFSVYIYNIWINENEKLITNHAKQIGFNILSFARHPLPHCHYKAYIMTIPYEQKDMVFDGSNWPNGIKVSRYWGNNNVNNIAINNNAINKRKRDDNRNEDPQVGNESTLHSTQNDFDIQNIEQPTSARQLIPPQVHLAKITKTSSTIQSTTDIDESNDNKMTH